MSGVERWYRTFFNDAALDLWQESRSEELTASEVNYIEATLALESPARLLDLACGNGRHATGLAARGHAVTGVDITEANRSRVEARAAEHDVSIELVIADMCDLGFDGGFDGAYCWGNSVGYFPRADMRSFFAGVSAALEPGARFVLDTAMVAESILPDLSRSSWVQINDRMRVLMGSEYDVRESRLDTEYTTIVDGQVIDTSTAHVWIFTSAELLEMATGAGFSVVALESDLDGNEFELGSDGLLLSLEKSL